MTGDHLMPHKTVTVTIYNEGSWCFIPVNFDPKAAFGKIRAPVKVTLNRYTYRSTIASMRGITCIPLRRSHREAAGVVGGESIAVTIELDTEPREVELPRDLARALRANKQIMKKWQSLSYTNRRESVEAIENAKRPATRARRLAATIESLDEVGRPTPAQQLRSLKSAKKPLDSKQPRRLIIKSIAAKQRPRRP
jgi:hypothetical protein